MDQQPVEDYLYGTIKIWGKVEGGVGGGGWRGGGEGVLNVYAHLGVWCLQCVTHSLTHSLNLKTEIGREGFLVSGPDTY